MKSLEKWCFENKRADILEEFGWVLGESNKNVRPSEIPYNSSQTAIWNCLLCGSSKSLKIKERVLLDKIVCLKCKRTKALEKRHRVLQSENQDIGYLAKSIHSSMPEQYIFYYLKKVFSDIESQKSFEWLGGMSIDIYIPEHKIGIEYDGERFHSNRVNDELKYELCKRHGVKLLRIVECSKTSIVKNEYFSHWHYLYGANYNYTNIDEAIFALLNFIDSSLEATYFENPIDVKIDIEKIEKHIAREFDKRTLLYKWAELGEYWDYERNGQIMPNHVFKSDNKLYYLQCPKCNTQYGFRPVKRRLCIPPCPCERSLYMEREKQILHISESSGLIEFDDTLLDRQIEDEILRSAKGMYQCYRFFGTIEAYELGTSEYSKSFLVDYFYKYTKKKMK